MTGYTVHTGSTEKFSEGFDRIFAKGAKKAAKAAGAKKAGGKKSVAGTGAVKKAAGKKRAKKKA